MSETNISANLPKSLFLRGASMHIGGLAGVFLAVTLSACSMTLEEEAAARVSVWEPSIYKELPFIRFNSGQSGGVQEDQIDPRTFEIESITNPVTSIRQSIDLALFHAAKVGQSNNFASFIVQDSKVRLTCSRNGGAWPTVKMTVRYGNEGDVIGIGEVRNVATVIADLSGRINSPDSTKVAKEKTYIENFRRCRAGTRIS